MNNDYTSESERKAYNKGVIARINGLSKSDCPYMQKAIDIITDGG